MALVIISLLGLLFWLLILYISRLVLINTHLYTKSFHKPNISRWKVILFTLIAIIPIVNIIFIIFLPVFLICKIEDIKFNPIYENNRIVKLCKWLTESI